MIQKTVDDVYKGRDFSILSIWRPELDALIISSLLLVISALYLLRAGIGRKADPDLAIKNKTE